MPLTKKRTFRHNKTRRQGKGKIYNVGNSLTSFEKEIIVKFLEMLNTVKLYHWKTYSYATHKATDELGDSLQKNIDSFVEVLLGKRGDRVNLMHLKKISLKDFDSASAFKKQINEYKSYLVNLDHHKALQGMSNSDLYTIRDEMLSDLNQFLYLFTFK